MRLALAQMNTVVGDLDGNRDRVLARLEEAREAGADLVLFPELAVTGYPPEDLLLRPGFLRAAARTLDEIAGATRDIAALVGTPHLDRDLFNACAVCVDGEVRFMYRKHFLPNYGVFDEDRYFQSGRDLVLLRAGEALIGPTICEDIWQPGPPATDLTLAGAHLVANISASPFHLGKGVEREQMLATRARDNSCWIAYVNAVGAQDELVFDVHSLVLDEEGEVVARGPAFEEALVVVDVDTTTAVARRLRDARRRALARALRELPDPPVIELPAGDAKGAIEPVVCVSMPSRFSSEGTRSDARRTAESLGTRILEIPIEPIVEAVGGALAAAFSGTDPGVAEENVQSRVRGLLVMALSNKFGWLPLATGNKSELSVGYATLYGDMAGGF